jgi:hypothetical protein
MHRTQNPTAPAADTADGSVVTPADTLRGAALYLETHGWIQHVYYGGTTADAFPPACADGAIGMAAYGRITGCPGRQKQDPGYRDYNRACEFLEGHLRDGGYKPPCDPWCSDEPQCLCDNDRTEIAFGWNDADSQTAENVIATLRAAADDWDYTHATEEDLETYAELCYSDDKLPDREGFLAWLGAR